MGFNIQAVDLIWLPCSKSQERRFGI